MRRAGIEAVLFDATGTLITLREPVGDTYARIASRHGVTLPAWRLDDAFARIVAGRDEQALPEASPEAVRAHERDAWRRVVRDTFRATDQTIRFADFDAFFDELFAAYASADTWRLRIGAREGLAALRAAGLRTGVVSNFDYRLTEILERLEITALFDTITLAGQHAARKPDPRLFAAALSAIGVPAKAAVYVGDDPTRDLAGATAAGLRALDVTTLGSLAELPERIATLAAGSS